MPLRRTRRRARRTADELARYLRTETIGGAIMLSAAVIALIWVNSPLSESYVAVRDAEIGPQSLNLHLSLGTWAADGLLAVFFFVAGLELKRELVVGELRSIKSAMLPVFAAIGGIVVPAGLAALIMFGAPGAGQAWAIPVATDIAFALAVLAIAARALPRSVRLFLLSLAVVDDLGAIILIAVLFTTSLSVFALLGAAALLGSYALLQHYRIRTAWLYVPITVGTWIAVHESGVHATVAGVALALLTRVRPDEGEDEAPAVRLEHRLQPLSAGFCVPVFAFFAAGVVVSGAALGGVFTDRVALGVVVGLLAGKFLGVFGGAALAVRLRLATLNDELRWRDIAAVAVLGGVGFTVSLLITELAFDDPMVLERVKIGVLIASAVASLIGAGLLKRRASVRSNGP